MSVELRKSPSGELVATNVYTDIAASTWYVDSDLGSDDNTGESATQAFATLDALNSAFENARLTGDVSIVLAGDFSAEDLLLDLVCDSDVTLTISGTPSELTNGTLTGYTFNDATNQPPEFADTGKNFTSYAGNLVRLTSGSFSGANGWVLKVNPTGVGTTTFGSAKFVYYPSDGSASPTFGPPPSAGDTYTIESVTPIRNVRINLQQTGSGSFGGILENIEATDSLNLPDNNGSVRFSVAKCKLPAAIQCGNALFVGCYFNASTENVVIDQTRGSYAGCSVLGSGTTKLVVRDGYSDLEEMLFSGAELNLQSNQSNVNGSLGFLNLTDAAAGAVILESNATANETNAGARIYGVTLAGVTIQIGNGSVYGAVSGTDPAVTGSTGAIEVGGTPDASFTRGFSLSYASGYVTAS